MFTPFQTDCRTSEGKYVGKRPYEFGTNGTRVPSRMKLGTGRGKPPGSSETGTSLVYLIGRDEELVRLEEEPA